MDRSKLPQNLFDRPNVMEHLTKIEQMSQKIGGTYKILKGKTEVELENAVVEALKEGWRLYGSPSAGDGVFIQALTKGIL